MSRANVSLSFAEAQALSRSGGTVGVGGSGAIEGPAIEIVDEFLYQSYFDDTLGPRAILTQSKNEAIVASTLKVVQTAGYAIGLHPTSETPIAVRFLAGQQQGASSFLRLKPGEVIRPNGYNGKPGQFSGFEYGLPFGWLGGGMTNLVVFRSPDATVNWYDRNEIVFHRQRLQIYAPGDVPGPTTLVPNWPLRFPWESAKRGTIPVTQAGQPGLAVTPTKTLLRLRMTALAAPSDMRVLLVGMNALEEAADGTVSLAAVPDAIDITWGQWASVASAGYATQYQSEIDETELTLLGSSTGGIILVDNSGGSLDGEYVDIVRYGVL